jgi:hypothetical protein
MLLHDEEKLLKLEERKLDRQQMLEKQMLAVALVKSVVKKEEGSSQQNQETRDIGPQHIETNVYKSTRKRRKIIDASNPCPTNRSSDDVLDNVLALSPAASGKTFPRENGEIMKHIEAVATRVSPRIKSRAAKSKNVGLKADYAIVRHTTRLTPKPSVPVPNPILPSPAPSTLKDMINEVPSQPITRAKKKTKDSASLLVGKTTRQRSTGNSMPSSSSVDDTVSIRPNAPTPTKSNETKSGDHLIFPGRRRIFSIDLDRKFHNEIFMLHDSSIFLHFLRYSFS